MPSVRPARRFRPARAATALVLCFTLALGALSLFLPKRGFSETENRVLADPPALSLSSLSDGGFFRDAETYFADHFAGRDAWIRLHARFRILTGAREINGVYVGRKGQLFLIPGEPDETDLKQKAAAMEAFSAAHPEIACYAAIAPNAVGVQTARLPAHAAAPDQKSQLEAFYGMLKNVKAVDLFTPLAAHADEYVYYKTDHHWTSLGASYAFEAIRTAMRLPAGPTGYERLAVSESFRGTLAGKCGYSKSFDTVELFVPETDVRYYVLNPATGEKRGSMYHEAALLTKDHYAVFFGGNAPLTVIRTTADTNRRLLVFKDSYANALMQLLYPFFDEIVMVDPRYYYDDLEPVINGYAVTHALFLYNADTFWGDASLVNILQ